MACIDAVWELPRQVTQGDLGSTPSLRKLCGPLYAIDYVVSGGARYALDFNTCPGATGAVLPAPSIAEALKEWWGWSENS
ncbi:hypothetical protein ACFP81_03675 [Deinococcus lacus]|uniref:ATP-grasp domain-containing protein n=1 Tax=Deinococcus lacus TaxID=392561 RepID=A0ABW1YB66_9DEIO